MINMETLYRNGETDIIYQVNGKGQVVREEFGNEIPLTGKFWDYVESNLEELGDEVVHFEIWDWEYKVMVYTHGIRVEYYFEDYTISKWEYVVNLDVIKRLVNAKVKVVVE